MEISSPRELIAAIPHLLGFAPEDSLVIVALNENSVHSMVRIDWPISNDVIKGSLTRYAESLADCEMVFTYYSDSDVIEQGEVNDLFAEFTTLDVLVVKNNRWRSQMCTDSDCCPSEGRSVLQDTSVSDAEFIYRGSSPFASRDEMVQAISGCALNEDERTKCIAAFTGLPTDYENQTEVDWLLNQSTIGLQEDWWALARAARAIQDIRIRDALLRRAFEDYEVRVNLRIWLMANLSRIPDSYVAASATVLAGVVWLDGNGPLARIALDRALEADPQYSLAQLLDTALVNAVPSRVWTESLEAVSYEECLAGAA